MKNTILVNGKRKVCRIFDIGAKGSIDRYTVAFKGYWVSGFGMVYPYLASDDTPFHPQGFGQHGENPTFLTGRHLGKRVPSDVLPLQVQQFILENV